MKPIVHRFHLVLLAALLAGCATTDPLAPETLLGEREQKSLLAKARPASEFNFAPLPLGNGTIYIGSTLLRREQSATLFSFDSSMPVIEIMGRQGMQFLVDTASAESWIEYSSAARNKVVFLKNNGQIIPYLGQAGTEGASAYAGVVPRLRIDSIDLENVPFFVRMAKGTMEPVVYSKTAPRVDGVLGYDNLRQFESIQFDLQAGIIRISTSETYSPDQQRLVGEAPISTICRDRLAVDGAIDGQSVPIVLDFAGDLAFARGDTRAAKTDQVDLGEIVYLNVPTSVLAAHDAYPRAGRNLLKKYLVTVCPRDGVVYFERPLQAD